MARNRHHSCAIWLLLVAAMFLRAAVPSGWMPVSDQAGTRIAVCLDASGSGPSDAFEAALQKTRAALSSNSGKSHRKAADHDPCPYALALSGALDTPAQLPAAASRLAVAEPVYSGHVAARLVARKGLRPPARGPPSFA